MGDILGRDQSGLPQFAYANIVEDQHILTIAQEDVSGMIAGKIPITAIEYERLEAYSQAHTIEL